MNIMGVLGGLDKLKLLRDVKSISAKDQETILRILTLVGPKVLSEDNAKIIASCVSLEEVLSVAPAMIKEFENGKGDPEVTEDNSVLICPHCNETVHL